MCSDSRLKVLELASCVVNPPGLVSWNSLKRLCFYDVSVSDDAAMEGIVSGCPVLEILEVCRYRVSSGMRVRSGSLRELVLSGYVHHCDEENCDAYLEIWAPELRNLTISRCFYTWNVRLEDVTALVRADLSFYLEIDDEEVEVDDVEEYDKYLDLVEGLLKNLGHVEELKLATWCIHVRSSAQIVNVVFEKRKNRQLEPCRRFLLLQGFWVLLPLI